MYKVSAMNDQEEDYDLFLKAPLRTENVLVEDGQHFLLTYNYMEAGEKVLCYKLCWNNFRHIVTPSMILQQTPKS